MVKQTAEISRKWDLHSTADEQRDQRSFGDSDLERG